ncbi:hypothetical protein AMS68_000312 [Peltaster fructicola]|uniref:RNA polymerase II degradation factor 1 n=1 Tax=Peltaster fructicola TaxID=286661 RepID=A0A6H0XJJ2_9PEZI|nr:hypothetical protein AMS68_000312 [Peltaster fructicola]
MSEVDTRPASTRGRSSARGGRGGFSRGGPRGGKRINGTSESAAVEESFDDQGELGDMKRKYTAQLPVLKDMFADWNDVDLLFALQESDGDLAATVDKISQGNVSQFSEVKKNKDRARSRVKEEPTTTPSDKPVGSIRGRGRGGLEGTRGRGGRGSDRGRGGHRGARGGHATTNGAVKDGDGPSVPTTESTAWDTGATEASTSGWDTAAAAEPAAAPAAAPVEEKPAQSLLKKTWASMFSQPKPAPAPAPAPAAKAEPEPPAPLPEPEIVPDVPTPAILTEETQPAILAAAIIDGDATTEEAQIPPPKNPLTQENVEHLPDESNPPATHTAASTVDSNDPRNLTPLPGQQAPIGRPPLGGFAASAQRAASGSMRSASFQRRVLEQQEAVVMPGHNAVDRAAVQFGSMGLNGEPGLDVDDEREDPETRQAPQHSPPSQPKASLPPSRQTASTTDTGVVDTTTKQAPGLPPASQQNVPQLQESSLTQGLQQEQQQHAYGQSQFGGYGQSAPQHDAQAAQQKPYDPFTSQGQHPQYDRFGQPIQAPQQSSQQGHSGFGGLPSGQHDYSSYYGSEQHRNAYNHYYGAQNNYAQQDNRSQGQQQDANLGQRAASGYGSEQAYAAQAQQQVSMQYDSLSRADLLKARYAEGGNSGNTTPNPLMSGQQQHNPAAQQSAHSMHHQQQGQSQHQQQQQHPYGTNASGFPYGHPYFNSPYAQAYQNQFGFSGYPQGYTGKTGGMYGAPQGYGMGSQSSYEQHSSSPGNTNAFSQNQQSSLRSASGVSSGLGGATLDEYGRQPAQASSHANSSFGINDPFARTPSGFGAQGYAGQTTTAGHEDSLKAYDSTKTGSSPALAQAGRPSSAANNVPATTQAGHPHPQGQQGFGGYQGYPAQNSQYGGLGGLGGHQQQGQTQQGQYSGYGASNFSQYGSYNSRGGWGQTYGGGH